MVTFSARLGRNSTYSYMQKVEIIDISTQQTTSPPDRPTTDTVLTIVVVVVVVVDRRMRNLTIYLLHFSSSQSKDRHRLALFTSCQTALNSSQADLSSILFEIAAHK